MDTDQLILFPPTTPLKKRCNRCKQLLLVTSFGRNKARPDGRQDRCPPCHSAAIKEYYHAHPETRAATINYSAVWRRKNPESYNLSQLRHRLKLKGISLEEYQAAVEHQKGMCGICGSTEVRRKNSRQWYVDHCHVTGKFRGLLCNNCNSALGLLRDDIAVLERAIAYLKASQEEG